MIYPVFFEPQNARQCGKHALNNLWQREIFSKECLDQIAFQLDQEEIALERILGEQEDDGRARNYTKYGDYTITVLMRAVFMITGREMLNLASKEPRSVKASKATRKELGFIVCEGAEGDRSGHWFCVRKIGKKWFKIDSQRKLGPELLETVGEQISIFATEAKRREFTAIYVVVKNSKSDQL